MQIALNFAGWSPFRFIHLILNLHPLITSLIFCNLLEAHLLVFFASALGSKSSFLIDPLRN